MSLKGFLIELLELNTEYNVRGCLPRPSKSLFGCSLIRGTKGDGATYQARFFGASQVQPVMA